MRNIIPAFGDKLAVLGGVFEQNCNLSDPLLDVGPSIFDWVQVRTVRWLPLKLVYSFTLQPHFGPIVDRRA